MSSTKTIGLSVVASSVRWWPFQLSTWGHKVIALDPAADCPASRVAEIIVALTTTYALRQLADRCDVLTYEFENVDADGLDAVIKKDSSHKEQTYFASPKTGFWEGLSFKQGTSHCGPLQGRDFKPRLSGYRPLENVCPKTATGITMAMVKGHSLRSRLGRSLCASWLSRLCFEEFVNFDRNFGHRVWKWQGRDGFPVQENIHRNNILSKPSCPLAFQKSSWKKPKPWQCNRRTTELVWTLCVEMFATADDIIVNEIAPRPHNSGHYSIEACDFLSLIPIS